MIGLGGILLNNSKKILNNLSIVFFALSLLAFVQAIWGICQYLNLLPSYNFYFKVTGTFDNPAGFVVCLSGLLPFSLIIIQSKNRIYKIAGSIISSIICLAVILSSSRAGVLAIIGSVFICLFPFNKWNKKWVLTLILLFIIILIPVLYLTKKNSTNGRLLIWNVSCDMIKKAPLLGHGPGSFHAKYMLFQSLYFQENKNDDSSILADNVTHPFNEYLKIWIEYGLFGLVAFLMYCITGGYVCVKSWAPEKKPVLGSLFSVGLCACFSYPISYPVTWGILAFAIAILFYDKNNKNKISISLLFRFVCISISVIFLCILINKVVVELKWKQAAYRSLSGETENMLSEFDLLYEYLNNNGLFLYNYGAELHYIKKYDESIKILNECVNYWNDIDVQILLADNYYHKGMYSQAELCSIEASNMCPNRFIPMYQLVKIYNKTGRKIEAYLLALEITKKDIKVPSLKVQKIIREMNLYVENNKHDFE